MMLTKRHKHRDQSPTQSLSPSRKLFVDYPYPLITELNKIDKQQKLSDHSHNLLSLRWYQGHFPKMFGILHSLRDHNSPTSILEQSFKQAHIDKCSSKVFVNNLQKETKPTRIKQILVTPTTPSINEDDEQSNEHHVQGIHNISLNHHIDDDRG